MDVPCQLVAPGLPHTAEANSACTVCASRARHPMAVPRSCPRLTPPLGTHPTHSCAGSNPHADVEDAVTIA
jgi:hypothetical protein